MKAQTAELDQQEWQLSDASGPVHKLELAGKLEKTGLSCCPSETTEGGVTEPPRWSLAKGLVLGLGEQDLQLAGRPGHGAEASREPWEPARPLCLA